MLSIGNNTSLKVVGDQDKELLLKEGENNVFLKDLIKDHSSYTKNTIILTLYLINYKIALIRTYSNFPVEISYNQSLHKETYHNDSLVKYDNLKSIKIMPLLYRKSQFLFEEFEQEIHFIDDTSIESPITKNSNADKQKPVKLSFFLQSLNRKPPHQTKFKIKTEPYHNSSQEDSD